MKNNKYLHMKKFIILFLAMLLISCGDDSEEKELKLQERIDSLETEISELQQANDPLSDHLMKKAFLTQQYPTFFDSIPEPEFYLLERIQEQSKIIPLKPVLGGTMRFTSVSFINDELIVAEYEDGHIMGKGIYRYRVNKAGELQLKLFATLDY